MRDFFASLWWWTRLAALLLVGVYLLALIWMNSGETPRLWYFFGRDASPVSIIAVVLVSFLAGGIVFTTGWALIKATYRYRRTREAKRVRVRASTRLEAERKAARLQVKPAPQPIVRAPAPPPVRTTIPRAASVDVAPGASTAETPPADLEPDDAAMPVVPADRYDVAPIPLADLPAKPVDPELAREAPPIEPESPDDADDERPNGR